MALRDAIQRLFITISQGLVIEAGRTTLTFQKRIQDLKDAGVGEDEIRRIFLRDFMSENPVLFGEFKAGVRDTIAGAVHKANAIGIEESIDIDTTLMKWTTVGDERVCKDCKGRAGQVRTMEEWRLIGLPGSGFSVCSSRCRCQITPASVDAPDRIET